jgi:iron complex outermembrane receptor protein
MDCLGIDLKGEDMKHRDTLVVRRHALAAAIGIWMAGGWFAAAQAEDKLLGEVNVSADAIATGWVEPERETPGTRYRVGGEAMKYFDNPGGANPYTAVAEIPGVKVTPVDAYGLNNTQGGQKGLRIRGEVSTHGAAGTVEGLSLNGPGPGPGPLFLIDKENIASIGLAQGAMSADVGGLFNTYGAVDMQLLWPRAQAVREISLAAGSENFRRLHARLDTGELATGTAFFISASSTEADKWRGHGQAPGNRDNVELALSQKSGPFSANVFVVHNEQSQHNYKALTYAQARDLNKYRDYDYTDNPASADHYGYNRQDFSSDALIAELSYALSPATTVSFRPYYAKETGYYLYAGTTATQVLKWLIDHETYGFKSELVTLAAGTEYKFGYSWTSTEPPGPPTTRKQYQIVNGRLVFQQWAQLSELVDRHEFSNLYGVATHRSGPWTLQGGARYAREVLPGIDAYNAGNATAGATWDVSADAAIDRATKNAARSVDSRSFGHWLPQVGVGYQVDPRVELHANLGRNIGSPSLDAFNQALSGAIVNSEGYWQQLRPELSTNLDLGARLRFGGLTLDPTLYYSRSKDKAVRIYSAESNSAWSQNVGNTRAKGFQLAAGWMANDSLRIFGAYAYSRNYFAEDVRTAANKVLDVTGKQLPDVPKNMANLGLAWRTAGWTVAPMLKYVGERWATTDYTEKVGAYTTVDLTLAREGKSSLGSWEASLALMNVFDKKYIGQVVTSEVNTTANGAIYYPGAPRTLVAKLDFKF